MAGDVAMVMVLSFGHLGGKGQTTGVPGGGGALAMSSPRSRVEGRARGQALIDGGSGRGFSRRKLCVSTPVPTMPAGIVTLLGAVFWVPSPC
jgi:hypothetical protein